MTNNHDHMRQLARIIARLNRYYKARAITAPLWGRLVTAVIGEFRA